MRSGILAAALLALVLSAPLAGQAGTIVVNADERTLSNQGFVESPDVATWILNIADLFASGGPGDFHAYTVFPSFTESLLASTLTGAGHSYTTGLGITFDVPTLLGFDGIFLGGFLLNGPQIQTLIDYVNGGGSVYLALGTIVGAANEANIWNTFLNSFGLSLASTNNAVVGNVNVTGSSHPVFNGVSTLFQDDGTSISGSGVEVFLGPEGLIAITSVPEPASLVLLGIALAATSLMRRRPRRP